MRSALLVVLLLAGCGGISPTEPTAEPAAPLFDRGITTIHGIKTAYHDGTGGGATSCEFGTPMPSSTCRWLFASASTASVLTMWACSAAVKELTPAAIRGCLGSGLGTVGAWVAWGHTKDEDARVGKVRP